MNHSARQRPRGLASPRQLPETQADELATVDVLIPTYNRPACLAVTLTGLCSQTFRDFRVVVSDQSDVFDVADLAEIKAPLRVLQAHGHDVRMLKHLPRRGMAEQRQFLLDQVTAPYALFIDDDLILEPWLIQNMLAAIREEQIGFVGSAVIGLSFINDVRPHQQAIEFWEGPVEPETIVPDGYGWERWMLHNAANVYHIQERLELSPYNQRKYKVAWVGACAMYDTAKLREVGGYGFWRELPLEHAGEDVLAQMRVMAKYGGCGIIPSGAYHMELPTTVVERKVDAPKVLAL
jgi:glycosyltransferase involved in cell wall biosynthesis